MGCFTMFPLGVSLAGMFQKSSQLMCLLCRFVVLPNTVGREGVERQKVEGMGSTVITTLST